MDQISREGEHKLCAIWEYDKRQVNGAAFVYYGSKLLNPNLPMCQELVAYASKVLDAVEITEGPSHMEVMFTPTGPCLVEVGSRCQGGEGSWIPVVNQCIGFSQAAATIDVFLNGPLFDTLQATTYPMKKCGREIDLVSRCSGVVRAMPGEKVIKALPTFMSISWEIQPGDFVNATVDCFTRPGVVQLLGDSDEQCDRDVEIIHSLGAVGLLDFSVICPSPPNMGAVVVIDPFSSGANLAAMIVKMGYKLILLFSEKNSAMAQLKGPALGKSLVVQHDNLLPDQAQANRDTIEAIKEASRGCPVLAILPGAETGVPLADQLSSLFGTRSNGTDLSEARRNKHTMQETVRKAGIRGVAQRLCKSKEDCVEFFKSLPAPQICIVKPNESAGSDHVYKCSTVDEMVSAFMDIHGQSNGLGHLNEGALCQEFLSGTEYVVDGVSRDGVYKVTAVWEYDKRTVNGANFVYFGMRLRDASGEKEKKMIEYAASVVNALEIYHGPSHMEVSSHPIFSPFWGSYCCFCSVYVLLLFCFCPLYHLLYRHHRLSSGDLHSHRTLSRRGGL